MACVAKCCCPCFTPRVRYVRVPDGSAPAHAYAANRRLSVMRTESWAEVERRVQSQTDACFDIACCRAPRKLAATCLLLCLATVVVALVTALATMSIVEIVHANAPRSIYTCVNGATLLDTHVMSIYNQPTCVYGNGTDVADARPPFPAKAEPDYTPVQPLFGIHMPRLVLSIALIMFCASVFFCCSINVGFVAALEAHAHEKRKQNANDDGDECDDEDGARLRPSKPVDVMEELNAVRRDLRMKASAAESGSATGEMRARGT